jgi:hypothetical protein
MDLTPSAAAKLEKRPVLMNMSRGMFILPLRGGELKVARHRFGYVNLKRVARLGL